jgi:hypothetical protein
LAQPEQEKSDLKNKIIQISMAELGCQIFLGT